MEQATNRFAPGALADESAPPRKPQASAPAFDPPPLLSDALGETLAETFPEGARKPRHDGWTPEAVGVFLRSLAATGVVEHAARAAGLSAASAYAFRNRRQGRAFARMWDAMLIHRARARVASELQGRSIAGCVSIRKRDGEVVGEYHYYDNRLAMAMLTRLDRLAEREAASDAQLRALSEDLDDYIDCLAEGGDADAFVEARAPAEAEPEPAPLPVPDDDPELTAFARLTGCSDYSDVPGNEIEVTDLDPSRRSEWSPDQWIRAFRSGFFAWLENYRFSDGHGAPGPGAPLAFVTLRAAAAAALRGDSPDPANPMEMKRLGLAEDIEIDDLDLELVGGWSDEQLARGWCSGFLLEVPPELWEEAAALIDDDGDEL
ncbi:MAG: hypothetical protein E6G92_07265 [Alphaproteobacteria bacterium]|nr:MAG: hypothetical protein E6G92_07265 [Alphaproteobacteria bacterium]